MVSTAASRLLAFIVTIFEVQASSSPYDGCSEVFIGAGWAGVYSFYRRIMDDRSRAPKACLFEQSWRIGGRTYSVKVNQTDFIQDVGAYRFSPDMHLPGDLILHDLQIPTECYMESCPSAKEDFPPPFIFNYTAPLRRIVDPHTRLPSGYATPLHKMIDIAKGLGARVFTQAALTKLTISDDKTISLKFKNLKTGSVAQITSPEVLVLNLPRNRLFDVKGVEESLNPTVVDTLKCIVFDVPPDLFSEDFAQSLKTETTTLSKAYLYYEDAWWHTMLNETVGVWPPNSGFEAQLTPEGVRFNIRWHDGPVVCQEVNTSSCHGLLETYYSVSNETFYSSLSLSPEEPLGSVWNTDGPEAIEVLSWAHAGLMDSLTPLLVEKGINKNSIAPPSGLVVGVWRRPTLDAPLGQGYTAPTKVLYEPTMSGLPHDACGVPGLTDDSYRDTVLRPWGSDVPIFLVNNDWVCMNVRSFWGDWAEESLLMAERAMLLLGTKKPAWLDTDYYNEKVVSRVVHKSLLLLNSSSGDSFANSLRFKWLLVGFVLVVFVLCKYAAYIKKMRTKDYIAIP